MINSLQSMRFLMALMIFHHHFFIHPQIAQFGIFPVAFFFILSGFVMSLGYGEKVCDTNFNYWNYIKKRLIRIMPLNTLCLLLWLVVPIIVDFYNHTFSTETYLLVVLDFFLIQSWFPDSSIYCSCNAAAWFLSSILFCYIVFPPLIKILKNRNGKLFVVLLLIIYFVTVNFLPDNHLKDLIYNNPLFRCVDFVIGMSLGLFIKKSKTLTQHFYPSYPTLLELLSVLLVFFSIWIFDYIPMRYSYVSLYWIPTIAVIIIFSLSERSWGGQLCRLLQIEKLVYAGKLSFPFYMMHMIVIKWFRLLGKRIQLLDETIVGAIICIALIILMSHIYVRYIEPSVVKRLNKYCFNADE